MENLHRANSAIMACAGLVAALAVTVMLGWVIHSPALVQLHPTLVPIVFNSALCFLFCAASAALASGRVSRTASILALIPTFIGGTTLIQYAIEPPWDINTVIIEPFTHVASSAPGAMATNSAIAFVLSGTALAIIGRSARLKAGLLVCAALLGSLIITIGICTLIGDITGADTASLWGIRTRMPTHTASGFLALGLAVNLLVWQRTRGLPVWLPFTVFVGLLAATLSIAHAIRVGQNTRIQKAVLFETEQVARLIDNYLGQLYQIFEQSGRSWETSGGKPRELWETLSLSRMNASPPISGFIRADTYGYFRWIVPSEQAALFSGKNLHDYPIIASALMRANGTNTPQVTPILPDQLGLGTGHFLYLWPLRVGGRSDGTMLTIVDVNKLFTKALPASTLKYLSLTVTHEGATVFSNAKNADDNSVVGRARINNLGRIWQLEIKPTAAFLATSAPWYVIAVGTLIACLAAYSTFLALRRQRDLESLRLSEERLTLAVSGTSDGLWDWDIANDRIYGSPRFLEILGVATQVETSRAFRKLIHHEDRDALLNAYRQHVREGIPFDATFRVIRPDGNCIWANLRGRGTQNAAGKTTRMTGFATDVSHAQQVEKLKTEFIANVSHELRTPLTSIRGALALIRAGAAASPEKLQQLVELAQKNSERLIQLVNDLLDVSGSETGRLHFTLSNRRLNHLLQQAVESKRQSATDIEIVLTSLEPDAFIEMDASRFNQVLNHLISNAIKFSSQGDTIAISAIRRDGRVRISVADHGPGIAEDFRPYVFTKFLQGDGSATRQQGGTGVGLYICRKIIHGLGGEIGFDTETGKGSTFWFELPDAANSPATAQDSDAIPNDQPEEPIHVDRPRILHVEEDSDLRVVISQLLRETADIVPAATLNEALQQLADQDFGLVILDMNLPDGNGARLLQQMSASKANIPVLILSDQEADATIRKHAAETLIKSRITEAEISAVVARLLNQASKAA